MTVLLMFSGGKDSFISACKLVEAGYYVKLIAFNSGSLAGEKNIAYNATRLTQKYKTRVEFLGIRTTLATRMKIDRPWKECSIRELCSRYPDVTGVQSQCFFCQTSMWLEAIAYCVAKNIPNIATGYKRADNFCTGTTRYMDLIQEVCEEYNIDVVTPMWDFEDFDSNGADRRYQEMIDRGFIPQVLEPKCTIGLPAETKVSDKEMEQLINYFKAYVDYAQNIEKSSSILKVTKLTNESLTNMYNYEADDSVKEN